MSRGQRQIRKKGIAWLVRHHGEVPEHSVHVSKHYPPEESWTRTQVWWFDIGSAKIEGGCTEIHLLCERSDGSGFHHLRVPANFLAENRGQLCTASKNGKECYRLHLSADDGQVFVDLLGPGKIRFEGYVVAHED